MPLEASSCVSLLFAAQPETAGAQVWHFGPVRVEGGTIWRGLVTQCGRSKTAECTPKAQQLQVQMQAGAGAGAGCKPLNPSSSWQPRMEKLPEDCAKSAKKNNAPLSPPFPPLCAQFATCSPASLALRDGAHLPSLALACVGCMHQWKAKGLASWPHPCRAPFSRWLAPSSLVNARCNLRCYLRSPGEKQGTSSERPCSSPARPARRPTPVACPDEPEHASTHPSSVSGTMARMGNFGVETIRPRASPEPTGIPVPGADPTDFNPPRIGKLRQGKALALAPHNASSRSASRFVSRLSLLFLLPTSRANPPRSLGY
jgi:hypothetical protein